MRKIGIIGAGQTGRGFLARLVRNEFDIVFTDKNDALIESLQREGEYGISFFGNAREEIRISNFKAVKMSEAAEDFRDCEAVLISVRAENTRDAGMWLVENGMRDMPVVACENAEEPAALLEGTGLQAASGAIFCTTVEAGGLSIGSENYPYLLASRENLPECLLNASGVRAVEDFRLLMKRKLYTYNAASGIIAFMGAERRYESYPEAANDPYINDALDRFYAEINSAISKEFGIPEGEQAEFAALSKKKFQNRDIQDTVLRNAASPARKLGRKERIMEPMRLILANGGDASVLVETAVCALKYAGAKTGGQAGEILREAAGIQENDERFGLIIRAFGEGNA